MSKYLKPKYFGFYHGPSYGSYDTDHTMGFPTLEHAKATFRHFWNGTVVTDDYALNEDGLYVPWSMGDYTSTPATTREDYMDLYGAIECSYPGTYTESAEPLYRLTWGVRDGVKVEKS
jgi:hypothetical protein